MRPLTAVDACDLCGSHRSQPELTVGTWHLLRCAECGLVFTSPRYTLEAIKALYENDYYRTAADYFRAQLGPPAADDFELASAARRMLGKNAMRSLDIGCGTGRLVEAFRRSGFEALGIEPNKMAVEAGRQWQRNLVSGELSEIAAGSHDCLTALHVLEHTYSPREFLAHCCRILRRDGLLVVEVPNYGSRAARRLKERWEPLYPDTHLYQFTAETLGRYLAQAGFRAISTRRLGGAIVPAAAAENAGRCCAPEAAAVSNAKLRKMGLREWLWANRAAIFRIPYARQLARHLFWEVLGRGEFIRIYAKKA